ncbi:2-keto-3-deoxy-galactonokinase [Aquimixticola soesokkakensis]|uniref:2-keto-3-deoxy-galactonokinase n=1 Tax=Aquimixticola soesokkakensis TaxID=1519096 RepID=A0A1Y5TB83_9RHOB|nr:2-dehydro-3-deoxygalactonokinase [Aquimixticola soesokkakensis]SLN60046.1 2-keto-3-deoxy-galactonokinase [Aquimixticola soesokkakensis]
MSESPSQTPDWIGVDWGTSRLRVFAMRGARCLDTRQSDQGMGKVAAEAFEPALLELIAPWLQAGQVMPVLACGMVGARQGWREAPYRAVPCAPVAAGKAVQVPTRDPRICVRILPGLRQSAPSDVMRGEETQIAGFLAQRPAFNGTILLPGTHCKHVQIEAGQVIGFTTHMTGELFALLAEKSVLRHSIAPHGTDPEAFAAGVAQGLAGGAFAALFALRAEALVADLTPTAARARLSGLLIGAELSQSELQTCVIIGSGDIAQAYQAALAQRGVVAELCDGADLVREGLTAYRLGDQK